LKKRELSAVKFDNASVRYDDVAEILATPAARHHTLQEFSRLVDPAAEDRNQFINVTLPALHEGSKIGKADFHWLSLHNRDPDVATKFDILFCSRKHTVDRVHENPIAVLSECPVDVALRKCRGALLQFACDSFSNLSVESRLLFRRTASTRSFSPTCQLVPLLKFTHGSPIEFPLISLR
jgi:hypothetical protein